MRWEQEPTWKVDASYRASKHVCLEEEFLQYAEQYYLLALPRQIEKSINDERILLAVSRLAFLRKYGRPGVCIDRIEAHKWESLVELGGAKSVNWIQRAAINDNCSASQYCLGIHYHDGLALPKNERLAFFWYKKSAEQGNCRGQGILGYCYGEGFGVENLRVRRGRVSGHGVVNAEGCRMFAGAVTFSTDRAGRWIAGAACRWRGGAAEAPCLRCALPPAGRAGRDSRGAVFAWATGRSGTRGSRGGCSGETRRRG